VEGGATVAAEAADEAAARAAAWGSVDRAHDAGDGEAGADLFLRFFNGDGAAEGAARTATRYGSRTARFSPPERRSLVAPHAKAAFGLHLIDASSDRVVGTRLRALSATLDLGSVLS